MPNKIIAPNGTSEYNPVTNSNAVTTPSGTVLYNSFNAFQGGGLVGQQQWTYGQSGSTGFQNTGS